MNLNSVEQSPPLQAVGLNQVRLSGEYNFSLSSTLRGDAQEPGKEDVGRADPGSAPSLARET